MHPPDIIVGLCIFVVCAAVIIAIVGRRHEPDLGWDKDPLPKQAEDAEKLPIPVAPPELSEPSSTVVLDKTKLDLQI